MYRGSRYTLNVDPSTLPALRHSLASTYYVVIKQQVNSVQFTVDKRADKTNQIESIDDQPH